MVGSVRTFGFGEYEEMGVFYELGRLGRLEFRELIFFVFLSIRVLGFRFRIFKIFWKSGSRVRVGLG